MRTTVELPEDISDAARAFAEAKGISLGDAIAELVRRGLRRSAPARRGIFPLFTVSPDAPRITLEQTLAGEDDL